MTELRKRTVPRFVLRVQAGAAGGLIAAIAVAALFFLLGAIRLQPFSVPASLASGLFGGGSSATGATSQPGSFVAIVVEILAYTAVHLLAFGAVGATAGLVVTASSFWKSVLGGAAYAAVACTILLYLVRWLADAPVAVDVLGLPRVLLANALAGAIIGTAIYLGEQSSARELEA